MKDIKGQLTLRGVLIGCVGCAIITAASVYTALKMGALPWPIVFAAIISLFFLKALGHGKVNLNEANVTHTIMSAGAMVAGGLAFTIPGAWMLGLANEMSIADMFFVAASGVLIGLVCTALIRKHFIESAPLEYPIGEAAANTLIAGNEGGKVGVQLFSSMGIAGLYTALRDWLAILPTTFLSGISIPGVTFGIYNSPMMLAVGFLVGTSAVLVWFAGALFANFGLIVGGSFVGIWDISTAQGIVSSLGMGVMMGAGIGVIAKDIIPGAYRFFTRKDANKSKDIHKMNAPEKRGVAEKRNLVNKSATSNKENAANKNISASKNLRVRSISLAALFIASLALMLCFGLKLDALSCVVVTLLAFVATTMAAQSVGQTGIDPMEIFGLIVLLAVAALSSTVQVRLFFVAGVVAVACGLAGDVMNDFHAGKVLGTSPRAQWLGQAIGAIVGALVSVAVMAVLLNAYGSDAFGPGTEFVSAQASVVATMVSGIPSVEAFGIGLMLGIVLYFVRFPSMMLGLGIYLPFYLSFTAFLGLLVKLIFNAVAKRKDARAENTSEKSAELESDKKATGLKGNEKSAEDATQTGLIVASGILGGESIVGVLIALSAVLGASLG